MKHYFVIINEEGDKEHHSRILVSREDNANIEKEINEVCQNWYESDNEDDDGTPIPAEQNEDGAYLFECDTIYVSIDRYEEIPEEHYQILKRYLVEL